MIRIKLRPLERWPRDETKSRTTSAFKASWAATKNLLESEVWHLRANEAVMILDVMERDIRTDGELNMRARPSTPRVGLLIERRATRDGSLADRETLAFYCDRYVDWQDNVRAIALSLEALRKVDRYGVTNAGEQYTGWRAITTGSMTVTEARDLLGRLQGAAISVLPSTKELAAAYRNARRAAHPDAGGSHDLFVKVGEAGRVLGLS